LVREINALLTILKFELADYYYAVSVIESQLDKVRHYIVTQDEHHRKCSFTEEHNEFLKLNGHKIQD
jgi:hypothetical protein